MEDFCSLTWLDFNIQYQGGCQKNINQVYSDDNCCTLRYAYQDGSNWQLSVVDGEAAGPAALSLGQNDLAFNAASKQR